MNFELLRSRSVLAWPVYGLCAFLPLSIAGIGVFKLLTTLTALVVLIVAIAKGRRFLELRTGPTVLVLCLLGALAASLSYTSVSQQEALGVLAKYGKLLLIPAIALLIRNREQAITALRFYFSTQGFVLITSWLLFAGLDLPWVPAERNAIAVAYSSYLDQAILTAGFAALAWHLRADFPTRYGPRIAAALAVLAAMNLLFALPGRSGQLCLIAAIAIGIWWAMPRKLQPLAVLAPFLAFALAMTLSTHFRQGYTLAYSEAKTYQADPDGDKESSAGERLNYWRKSLQAMYERPMLGYGVGTWRQQYWLLMGDKLVKKNINVRNPHQEFLFWGVQLGAVGMLLLLSWIGSMWWQARQFEPSVQRATVSLLAVFVVACTLNSALYDGLVGDYFCALLAVLLSLGRFSPRALSRP
jgi:O-antigen ligase